MRKSSLLYPLCVELGAGVTDLKVGDRVGVFWHQRGCGRCDVCQSGHPSGCADMQNWMHLGGSNSELMVAWASGCALIPESVSFEAAAPIFCAGYTTMSGLRNADPKPGDRVAVLGMGGLGHLALQFAKALGLSTVAITGQADKRQELHELGADDVILSGGDAGKALLDAGGADIVLSTTISAQQISSTFNGLRPGGWSRARFAIARCCSTLPTEVRAIASRDSLAPPPPGPGARRWGWARRADSLLPCHE